MKSERNSFESVECGGEDGKVVESGSCPDADVIGDDN